MAIGDAFGMGIAMVQAGGTSAPFFAVCSKAVAYVAEAAFAVLGIGCHHANGEGTMPTEVAGVGKRSPVLQQGVEKKRDCQQTVNRALDENRYRQQIKR